MGGGVGGAVGWGSGVGGIKHLMAGMVALSKILSDASSDAMHSTEGFDSW